MTNEMFFQDLNKDITEAKTKKTLFFLSNRLKRFINSTITQPISKTYKATILRGYKSSLKAIKSKMREV